MGFSRRALLDDPSFGEPVVYGCNAEVLRRVAGGPVDDPRYCCEAAGATFSKRFDFSEQEAEGKAKKKKKKQQEAASEDDSESVDGEEYGKKKKGLKDKSSGGALKMSDLLKDVDLYALLGVPEAASAEELKKAYRQLALTAHPDKLDKGVDEATAKKAQEKFVQIQEAYELLSEPAKRLQYDSSLDFDDSLPRFKPSENEDFFEVFAEAFKRNARFSTKRPVPELGDADTKPEVWKRFYEFWYGFSSWRDPIILAQKDGEELMDLADAECREEKRWMMRENERIAKKYRQAERDRISELVRLSEKYDPRIAAEKEAKRAAREADMARKKEEQNAAQRKKDEEERVRREAEEAERQKENERKAKEKAEREAVKNELKKCRQRLRGFHESVKQFVLLDQLNEVCLQFDEAQLRKLGDDVQKALKKSAEKAAALFHAAIESLGLTAVTAVKADEETESTSSGQSSEELDPEELQRRKEAAAKAAKVRAEKEKKNREEEAAREVERAKREAEKAEEKKKRDELKRKEQAQAEAKKRQQEKKDEEKAKRQGEQARKKAEADEVKKEQQREEAKQRALEQAEKDKQEALARKAEMDTERVQQLFSADRLERLGLLDAVAEEALQAELQSAADADEALSCALHTLKADGAEKELLVDRAMALVHKVGPIWPLGLLPPAGIQLPSAVRNRVKKARQRLRDQMGTFLAKGEVAAAGAMSDWQTGIVDGSEELPVWSPEEREEEERKAKEAKEAKAKEASGGKKKKAKETKGGDEDLDKLLAELGGGAAAPDGSSPSSKKAGKKKK